MDQTYQDWECIIVNDGSPDNTEEVAKKWLTKDSRFKYLYKENGGLSSARNAGIAQAEGEWILPLDSDDYIGLKYLELSAAEIKRGHDLIYFRMKLFGSVNGEYTADFDYNELLYFNPFYCSCVFPKYKWQYLGGYDENLVYGKEDWEFWINMVYNTPTQVIRNDYIGFYYRKKEDSMLSNLQSSADKNMFSKTYIIRKHAQHYANSGSYVLANIKTIKENQILIKKYQSLITDNMIIKSVNRIRKFLKIKI